MRIFSLHLFFNHKVWSEPLTGGRVILARDAFFYPCWTFFVFIIINGLTGAFFVAYFPVCLCSLFRLISSQEQSQLQTLRVGVDESNNMANNRHKLTRKGRPVMKPRGSVCSNRAVITMDACPKIHKHAQVIVHERGCKGPYSSV